MFTITGLHIYKDCKYIHNLKEDTTYKLGHRVEKNFYAPNICVSAIVGKNGAGKSSLLDMIFRIINNISFCLYANTPRNAADPLSYISGLIADLHYLHDSKEGIIQVRDGIVGFVYGEEKYRFVMYRPEYQVAFNTDDIFEEYTDWTNNSFDQQKAIAKLFFYTIATNYSMQSFIAGDYEHETSLIKKDEKNDNNIFAKSWLNNLFHKNDGYLCPIVLNPYRSNGWINMNNEEHLTAQRLSALLVEEDEDNPILEGYEFVSLNSMMQPRTLREKFTSIVDDRVKLYPSKEEVEEYNKHCLDEKDYMTYDPNEDLWDFEKWALDKNSYSHAILSELRCGVKKNMPHIQLYIRMYVVYKVLSVAAKYPSYTYYKPYLGNINFTFASPLPDDRNNTLQRARDLARTVKNDSSHIGLKLRQALNFIRRGRRIGDLDIPVILNYDKYAELLGIKAKGMTIERRMEWLPPSIFHTQIQLRKKGSKDIVPLNHLSSGERQFIYLMSTLVYHSYNLKSIPKNGTRVRYNKINFILDEIEICFHPEYQRTLIKKLIDLLVRLNLNKDFDINILLTTHSPFILSDLPKQNILYLEDGKTAEDTDSIKNTFAANVGDLLHQSFFLKNGFMGAKAQEKLKDLYDILTSENGNEPCSKLSRLVDMIGDDLLRQQFRLLLNDYKQARKKKDKKMSNEDRLIKIRQLEDEIARLKALNDEEDKDNR